MEQYENVKMDVLVFESEDVITCSPDNEGQEI